MSGPLSGVRVIDLTQVVLGPYATQIMGDMGADVIKVEPPQGDVTRRQSPARTAGMSAMFLNLNRNKRGIALDLKSVGGFKALTRLVAGADVLVHNMRAGAARRLGIDDVALRALNPRLVYCSAYGFSERGPYAGRPAYDDIIQAISGMAQLQAGTGGPRFVNTTIADKVAGLTLLSSIMMALFHRERSGLGQSIEVPMFESMVAFLLAEHLGGATFEPPVGAPGYSRVLDPHRRPYHTSDGYVAVLPYNWPQWVGLCGLVGRADLTIDPRFGSEAAISANFDAFQLELDEAFSKRSTSEWLVLLEEADIPGMPAKTLQGVFDDPHLLEIGFFSFMNHPTEGLLRNVGIPVHFSSTPGEVRRLAPSLGMHSVEVLKEVGFAEREIEQMIASRELFTGTH